MHSTFKHIAIATIVAATTLSAMAEVKKESQNGYSWLVSPIVAKGNDSIKIETQKMSRANFPQSTKNALAFAANFRCVRPGCGRLTHAFNPKTETFQHVGAASHDIAASDFGPRPSDDLTPEQKKAYENGAWLCRQCATTVDVFEHDFHAGTISGWQTSATDILRNGVVQPINPRLINLREACSAARTFCKKFEQITIDGNFSTNFGFSWKSICSIRDLQRACVPFGPLNELCSLYPHTANMQTKILHGLRILDHEVTNPTFWYFDQTYRTYYPINNWAFGESRQKVIALWKEIYETKTQLLDFALFGKFEQSDMLEYW